MDRRIVIADAAVSLIARAGIRSLTHRALDELVELPPGSVSYYFRTKGELLSAVAERITESSRSSFAAVTSQSGSQVDATVAYIDGLLVDRVDQVRARHALLVDPTIGVDTRKALADCLFSVDRATELFDDRSIAVGYVALCEGLIVTALLRGHTTDSLRVPFAAYLRGAGSAAGDRAAVDRAAGISDDDSPA